MAKVLANPSERKGKTSLYLLCKAVVGPLGYSVSCSLKFLMLMLMLLPSSPGLGSGSDPVLDMLLIQLQRTV